MTGRARSLLIVAVATAAFASAVTLASAQTSVTPAVSSVAWTGTFDGFPATSWHSAWGATSDSQLCQGATSTATCNWGYSNMQPVSDPTAPGNGQALKVTYPAPSGPPSCGCGLGGGQFYQDLTAAGLSSLAASPTVDLKYWYKFPVGFDFGKKTAGKMPGLYGGVPGCESGGQHCQGGWSTRYMWRGGSASAPNGELYFYTGAGSGFGADLGVGSWKFAADGNWHSIEQLVNVPTGQITIWSDGTQAFQTTQNLGGTPPSGVFFSTFHGGHDTSWSPSHTTTDEFADFTLSTAHQAGGPSATPTASASPTPSKSPMPTPTGSATPTPTGSPGPVTGVSAAIAKTKDWGSGFTDQVTVTNHSGTTLNGWNVQFDLDPSMNIETESNATLTSSGNHQTFTNTTADATIADGSSVTFEFSGDYTSHYIAPTNVTVNGHGSGGTPTPTASASPTPSASPTASAPPTPTPTPTPTASGPGGGTFTQTDIDTAVAAPLIAFAAPTTSVPRPGTNPVNLGAAKVLSYLALVDRQQPGAKATNGTTVDNALLAQIRNLIAGGNEPDADGGLEGWSHAPVAQALLLLKNGPAWAELSTADQNKTTLLEQALGYAGNYTYNDASSFSSGICGFGNFSKTNNPNYEDGYVDVEAAAIQFFGASTWDTMLANFSDATMTAQLNKAGLTNAGGCYATVGTAANTPIKRPFVWKSHHSSDLMGIWNQLAADTFDQTVTSTNGPAHIADNTTSPEQGQFGMGHEFNSTDSSGLRSSALYTFEGWMNVTGNRVAMSALGTFTCAAASSAARYNIGSQDLIYKLHHGYVSQALNQSQLLVDDHGDPATDGPNVKGYQYDHDAYTAIVSTQSC
jgi:hypothetical protein